MKAIEEIILKIIDPLVNEKEGLMIRKMPESSGNEELYLIIGDSSDIARLIGHGGTIANSIREVVSVAGKLSNRRIRLKFESFKDFDADQ